MKQYGLIGFPLGHSFSKKYFDQKFKTEDIKGCSYDLFPLQNLSDFPALLDSFPALVGLNVTIPYKKSILPFLHDLDQTALAVGAVNTIRIRKGHLTGYNTDVHGFEKSLLQFLEENGQQPANLTALVLGSGGASNAVTFVLSKLGIDFKIVSRQPQPGQLSYEELFQTGLVSYQLVINTTPVGMHPLEKESPALPYHTINNGHLFFDLIYNPEKTLFLAKAETRGARICNGLQMLHAQAEKAWQIWNED